MRGSRLTEMTAPMLVPFRDDSDDVRATLERFYRGELEEENTRMRVRWLRLKQARGVTVISNSDGNPR